MDELDILRQQMNSLKENLDKSRIVTRELLISVMKQKASWLNIMVRSEFVIIPLAVLMFLGMSFSIGISVWIAITFGIFALVDSIIDLKTTLIPTREITNYDMMALRRKLIGQKRMRKIQLMITVPLAALWLIWFWTDYSLSAGGYTLSTMPRTHMALLIISIVFFILVCLLVTAFLYRKMQRTNDALIGHIDEFDRIDSDKE